MKHLFLIAALLIANSALADNEKDIKLKCSWLSGTKSGTLSPVLKERFGASAEIVSIDGHSVFVFKNSYEHGISIWVKQPEGSTVVASGTTRLVEQKILRKEGGEFTVRCFDPKAK